jgi:RNA polymerase sigma factor (sigma-70 family)
MVSRAGVACLSLTLAGRRPAEENSGPVEGCPLEERDLVERARGGDMDAYSELVRRHADLAFRTAYLITGSAPDAEDATQEAFLAAFKAFHRFRPGAPVRPWLLRIVANFARNRRRSALRHHGLELRTVDSTSGQSADASPERAAELAEERTALLRAVAELRDDERDVVACRFFLDLSVAETARVLRCREGTVKSRLSRALARLRQSLETTA